MANWADFPGTNQYSDDWLELTRNNDICHITDSTPPSHRHNQSLTSFPNPAFAPGFNAAGTAFPVLKSQLLLLMSKAGAGSLFPAQQSIAPQNDTNSTWEPPPPAFSYVLVVRQHLLLLATDSDQRQWLFEVPEQNIVLCLQLLDLRLNHPSLSGTAPDQDCELF
jgi:hypothetical protein